MIYNKKIIVAGGDLRAAHLAKLLSQSNNVYTIGLENAAESDGIQRLSLRDFLSFCPDYIILPISPFNEKGELCTPFSELKITSADILSFACPSTCILGGNLSKDFSRLLQEASLPFYDYLLREELSIMNAIPTAEGALQIALEELPRTIYGIKAVIIGYGRIGKVMARLLSSLGASVTVSARKFADLAWIEANGFCSVLTSELPVVLPEAELIINTVPASVLNEAALKKVSSECLLIDLASKPGGIDFESAKKLSLKAVWALSLPGKTAPLSAGQIIYDTICNIDSERRLQHE